MRITVCGHAGLLIDAAGETVLLDPILRSTPLGIGSTVYWPGRRLERERVPAPTILVITHAHFDHFDRPTLEALPRDIDVIIPRDPRISALFRELNYTRLHTLGPWETFARGGLRILATPSTAPVVEDEYGVVFATERERFWHMSDAEVTPEVGLRLRRELGTIQVVSAKFQPQARAHLSTIFSLGMQLDKEELFSWLETAAVTEPRFVFPYAAGVVLDGEHRWMNKYIFPVTEKEVVELLRARLGARSRAGQVKPGDVLTVTGDQIAHQPQAAAFVRHDPTVDIDCAWEPLPVEALRGLTLASERRELEQRLCETLEGPFLTWVARDLISPHGQLRKFSEYRVKWQAVVHAGEGERLCYAIDFDDRSVELTEGLLPGANYFVHVSGRGLLRALRSDQLAERNLFTCAELRLYEKILQVREGRFWAPPAPARELFLRDLPEPLATFLATEPPPQMAGPRLGPAANALPSYVEGPA